MSRIEVIVVGPEAELFYANADSVHPSIDSAVRALTPDESP